MFKSYRDTQNKENLDKVSVEGTAEGTSDRHFCVESYPG